MERTKRILVVEDEGLVALDLQDRLIRAGYEVPEVATNSNEALLGVETSEPDLVIMDIHLKGCADGIDTAERIREQWQIPVIFVTANADPHTLERASRTLPFAYFVKPIPFRSLTSSIEMALYRAHVDERSLWQSRLQNSRGEMAVVTDTEGIVQYLNPAALRFLAFEEADALGKSLGAVLRLSNREREDLTAVALQDAVQLGSYQFPPETFLSVPAGALKIPVEGATSVQRVRGQPRGVVFMMRDAGTRALNDQQIRADQEMLALGHFASGVGETMQGLFHAISDLAVTASPEAAVLEPACEIGMGIARQLSSIGAQQPAQSQLVNVNSCIARNVPIFQRLIGDSVQLSVNLCSENMSVRLPFCSLEHVLMNVLVNARRRLAGPGSIRLETAVVKGLREEVRIDFFLQRSGSAAWTPFGFPFEAEQRNAELSVANAIVTAAEGFLHYKQRWANRAEFEVRLPCHLAADPAIEKGLILLVGATEEATQVLEKALASRHYTVLHSTSASEALIVAQFHLGPITAVVADIDTVSGQDRDRVQRAFRDRNPQTKFLWRTFDQEVDLREELV